MRNRNGGSNGGSNRGSNRANGANGVPDGTAVALFSLRGGRGGSVQGSFSSSASRPPIGIAGHLLVPRKPRVARAVCVGASSVVLWPGRFR